MTPEILLRLALTIAIIGIGWAFYRLANRVILQRAYYKAGKLESVQPGRPALLYFTTPTCAPCKIIQRPAIQQLKTQVGEQLQVVEIDASLHPEIASRWGVLSVPTTFILDSQGRPRHVNHGVAPTDKLLKQLENIS
ncbi:MAG: hypothetical protein H6Q38_780 [Chloroflexi bacterium]|nr:hypothetical protein [Chloroflexota bacterium]